MNTYIREHAQLHGTKFMCLEGGCGACIVNVKGIHPVTKETVTWAVNSCLMPIYSCHNLEIKTVEGIGNKKDGYHPTQVRLAHLNGTQCGFCSPGMVMNMYSLLESKNGHVTMNEIENSFGGNICRCTGYRPILDAFKGFALNADDVYKELCADIEDIYKMCPKTGQSCTGNCKMNNEVNKLSFVFEDNKEWHKVTAINEIFEIFQRIQSRPYMLVAGNTAHGVYRRNPNIEVFIDITGVAELKTFTADTSISFGANISLTEAMDHFEKTASTKPEFEYLRKLVYHIDLIANVPVRNSGTIAGNLSIKNQHNEFPSDIYLIFETVRATVTVASGVGITQDMSILDYIKSDMNKKLITKITLPPLSSPKFIFQSHKIMPRAQNAHAYVNGAFLFEFNDAHNQVVSARICFGGINPQFTHASATEQLCVGKNLYTNESLKQLITSLKNEINPDEVMTDSSPEYRRKLAISLFYKFVLNSCDQARVKVEYKTGGEILLRTLSSGKQEFDTYRDNWPLTEPVPKIEGLYQCSGEAAYVNDIPHQPGELWAAYVHATDVHSKITKIETDDALVRI